MAPHIFPRQGNSPTTNNYLAGGLIGGFVGLIVLLCLLCHLCLRRSRTNKKGIEQRGGVTRPMMMELDPSSKSMPPPLPFSRQRLTASIVMPEKIIIRKPPSSQGLASKAVISSQPPPLHPSSPLSGQRPLSRTSTTSPRPHSMSLLNPACSRQSRASSGFSVYAQSSFPSEPNSHPPSLRSTSSTHAARHVRQPFEPALPDELALRCGEYLTVLQSFDDGWCLVARDTSRSSRASRLSVWMKNGEKTDADDVDIGLVPAWVFIKPLHGITVTRPFRSSSVNALNLDQAPGDARNAIISWSNFS